MRFHDSGTGFSLQLSARETHAWARRPGASWPCSFLSGRRLRVEIDRGGLVDMAIDGGRGNQDCPGDEFAAIVADHVAGRIGEDHPAWFVAVGQFR